MWTGPDLYDLENADDPAFDLGFWESVVREFGPRRMLELACGTGRLCGRRSGEPVMVVEGEMRAARAAGSSSTSSQTLRSTNRYEIFYEDGRVEHRITDLDRHIYFPDELELLLNACGLEVIERYGDYGRSPWNAASRRYLWLAAGHDTAREG